jgi:hypothetical protein
MLTECLDHSAAFLVLAVIQAVWCRTQDAASPDEQILMTSSRREAKLSKRLLSAAFTIRRASTRDRDVTGHRWLHRGL